jgi:hypothetical protein
MVKQHFVVIKAQDGNPRLYRMKEWLRQNPSFIPEGLDPTDTSHALRAALRRKGWILEEKADRVLVIKPDDEGEVEYAEIINPQDDEDELEEKEVIEAEEITFGLERDLQNALRFNIAQLEPGLTIIDGGSEKSTEAGRIDITAKDANGINVITELKAGKANPEVIAQVLAYMGSISEADGKPVRGILVAGDFHKRIILAAKAIPNLILKKYSFQFTFSDIR